MLQVFIRNSAVQESFCSRSRKLPGCFPRNLTLGFPFSSAGYCRPFEQCGDEPVVYFLVMRQIAPFFEDERKCSADVRGWQILFPAPLRVGDLSELKCMRCDASARRISTSLLLVIHTVVTSILFGSSCDYRVSPSDWHWLRNQCPVRLPDKPWLKVPLTDLL